MGERKQNAESESGALSGESKQEDASGVEADDEKSGGSEGGKIGEKADGIESELKQDENGGTTDNPTDFSPSVLVTKESDSQKELSDGEVENGAPSSTGVVSTMDQGSTETTKNNEANRQDELTAENEIEK